MQSQLHWASHIVCMKDHHLLKKLLYGELSWGSAPKEARISTSKTHWGYPWNLSLSPLIAWNIWFRTETSVVRLSDMEQMSLKQEETQQLSCTGNLEPLPPPFLVLTAQDSSAHRLVTLPICALTDVLLNHKVDRIVIIDYDGQRRRIILLQRGKRKKRERDDDKGRVNEEMNVKWLLGFGLL